MSYVIEKGVPIPTTATARAKYPFPKMEVGDSFLIATELQNRVAQAAFHYGKRNNVKLTLRKVADGVRVWRIA